MNIAKKIKTSIICILYISIILSCGGQVFAQSKYSPSDVFSGLEYTNKLLDALLLKQNINKLQLPLSKENAVKPMHVYELHVAVLREIHDYSLNNNRRPPPQPVSTPIEYTPTDVYYLTQLIINSIESTYRDNVGKINFSVTKRQNKTPSDVYRNLFHLYYKINRLNNKDKVTPTEVYSHIYRAKDDIQNTLFTLSNRLPDSNESKKRLLATAVYGMHTDGSSLLAFEEGKKPGHVFEKALQIRNKLNVLRKHNNLPQISHPETVDYTTIKPIDVFFQTQFIIAELNLLKIPLNIHSTTNSAKVFSKKTPSDVFHIMKHIDYMLDRLIGVMYEN